MINPSSYCNFSSSIFKIIPPLTNQQKIICGIFSIASIAFALLAAICFKERLFNLFNVKKRIIDPDGTIREGRFIEGRLNGPGKIIHPNGITVEGEFKDDLENGKVKVINKDGAQVIGEHKNGSWVGPVEHTDSKGNKVEAQYNQDLTFKGPVKVNFNDGTSVEGELIEGEFKDPKVIMIDEELIN